MDRTVDMTEVRRRIDAYVSGELEEQDLRQSVLSVVRAEPRLGGACVALISAMQRSRAISDALSASLTDDIGKLAGTGIAAPAGSDETGETESTEARTHFRAPQGEASMAAATDSPLVIATGIYSNPGTDVKTGGSEWDTPERLAEPAKPLFVGSILSKRFELKEELGRGGMGVVYKALDRATVQFNERSPFVAIKLLNEEFKRHPLAVRSLQREASKARKLAHPNIVTVFDFDRDAGNVYMVMELLSGRSLEELLRSEGGNGLPVRRVVEIVRYLGAALSYAHERGIVHADFKPGNAFITDEGIVKVLDFGIARAAQTRGEPSEKTRFDVSKLEAISPAYASLEMLKGEPADPRDDLYALACVTYELLTGRHPFKRIEANKALEAGLQPAPVAGLSRAQWQALRQGLAFERKDRTANVQTFINQFCESRRRRIWWPIAAACAAIALAAIPVVPRLWESHQADVLAEHLASGDPDVFARGVAEMRRAPERVRARALLVESARASLLRHYTSSVETAIAAPNFDFARARGSLSELGTLIPDSGDVAALAEQIDAAAKSDLVQQLSDRDRFLSQGVLVSADGAANLATALGNIRRIDPDNAALRDPGIAVAYATAAGHALDSSQLQRARSLVDTGLQFAPTDPALVDLGSRINAEVQRANDARRIADIKLRLSALNPAAPDFLDRVLAGRDDLAALMTLAPGDPLLATLQGSLQSVVAQRLRQQLKDNDVAAAQTLLLNVGDLLPEAATAAARASVMEAARAQQTQSLDVLDRLRRAVLTDRIAPAGGAGALDLYDTLLKAGASPDVLSEARDLLAYGYLREARRLRGAGNSDAHQAAVDAGIAMRPSAPLQLRLALERKAAAADASAAGELDAARQKFADLLHAQSLGQPELASMADTLDRLDALGASPQEQDAGLRQIEDRVIGEVTRIQQTAGTAQAQLFAQQSSATLFTSVRIADVARHLRSSEIGATKSFSPEILALRDQLNALIANPEATQRWADKLRDVVQKLSGAMPDDALLENARRVAVAKFVEAADDARAHKSLQDAAALLAIGRQIDPQSPELISASKAVTDEQAARSDAEARQEQQQGVEVLKRRFESEAAAGNLAAANTTANVLRRLLAGSVYVSTDLPRILIGGYVQTAKSQLARGDVNASLQTLADGRKRYGTSPELKDLEKRYVNIGDTYDRISTAVILNVTAQTAALERIRASEGGDYPMVERMLAQTLADRIADLQASNKSTLADGLLEGGRKLFPDSASLLEHGSAGVLSKGPLTVDPD